MEHLTLRDFVKCYTCGAAIIVTMEKQIEENIADKVETGFTGGYRNHCHKITVPDSW